MNTTAEGSGACGSEFFTRFGRVLSYILHPLLIPVIGVAVMLYGNTILSLMLPTAKLILLGMVALNTCIIPALAIALLRTLGFLPDLSLEHPRDRVIPMLIVAVCYVVCTFMLSNIMLAYLVKRFLFAALFCALFVFGVNFFWKISLHMTAAGGLIGLLLVFNFAGFANLPYILLGFLILAGMLGTARLQLGYHNLAQVAAGFFCGFLITSFTLLFF